MICYFCTAQSVEIIIPAYIANPDRSEVASSVPCGLTLWASIIHQRAVHAALLFEPFRSDFVAV